jgi:hypothetical protein
VSLSRYGDQDTHRFTASSQVKPTSRPAEDAGSGRTLRRSATALLACLVALGLVAVGIGVHAHAVAKQDGRIHQAQASVAPPLLIMQPQTVTESKRIGGLHFEMTTSPVIPGMNHFALRIDNGNKPLSLAEVTANATMLGMAMRPLHVAFTASADGRYAAAGLLPMFGDWQITLNVVRPHGGTVTALFPLSLGLPAGLFAPPQPKRK